MSGIEELKADITEGIDKMDEALPFVAKVHEKSEAISRGAYSIQLALDGFLGTVRQDRERFDEDVAGTLQAARSRYSEANRIMGDTLRGGGENAEAALQHLDKIRELGGMMVQATDIAERDLDNLKTILDAAAQQAKKLTRSTLALEMGAREIEQLHPDAKHAAEAYRDGL